MKLVNSTPIFNPNNNGFVYLCEDESGALWVRSSSGKWASIEKPANTEFVANEFAKLESVSSLDDVLQDNIAVSVVPVLKEITTEVSATSVAIVK